MKVEGSLEASLAARMSQSVASAEEAKTLGALRSGEDDAGQAFETYFSTLLVKELRKALPGGFFSGAGSDVYGAWFDEHLGAALAQRDTLGFAGMIKASLHRGEPSEAEAAADVEAEPDTAIERSPGRERGNADEARIAHEEKPS